MSEQQSEPKEPQVVSETKEKLSQAKEEIQEKLPSEPKNEADVILEAKEKLSQVIPTPPEATPVSSAQALKERLQWGEPALTIIDTRDRESYLEERITGSMLISDVQNLPENREIYLYGDSDEKVAEAANNLRQAGFSSVSQLQGGLPGWKAISGATEGRVATPN